VDSANAADSELPVNQQGHDAAANGVARHALGKRIRAARVERGMSLRALARALNASPGHISQIERGIVSPSVSLLYSIVGTLELPMNQLFGDAGPLTETGTPSVERTEGEERYVTRQGDRRALDIDTGVRWELLTPTPQEAVDFRELIYRPFGSSTKNEEFLRHSGRELGCVLEGRITVQLEFDRYLLGPGDTIAFESSLPHRIWNDQPVQARAIWVTLRH
jgi:transcriptional regulator with XRE-family HTH domain